MISHPHKAVFVHIPKCGGQSIEYLFLDDLGLDWEGRVALGLQPNSDPKAGPPRLGHLRAAEYVALGHLPPGDFATYFKFALCRNPYDRAVSMYNYLPLPLPLLGRKLSFDLFLRVWLPRRFADLRRGGRWTWRNNAWFVRPQVDYLIDAAGNLMVDKLYRLEEIGAAGADIVARCGLSSSLRHVNASRKTMVAADLSPSHKRLIERLYHADFDLLGYRV